MRPAPFPTTATAVRLLLRPMHGAEAVSVHDSRSGSPQRVDEPQGDEVQGGITRNQVRVLRRHYGTEHWNAIFGQYI